MKSKMILRLLVVGLWSLCLVSYGEDLSALRQQAEQGNARAQCRLGDRFFLGQEVSQDYTEAVKWYRLAAEQGDDKAQCNLGFCLGNGQGVPKDQKEAVKWFRLAAEQGNAEAQYNLGFCLSNGQGVPQDRQEAVKWYRLAAEQGNMTAKSALNPVTEKKQIPAPKTSAETTRAMTVKFSAHIRALVEQLGDFSVMVSDAKTGDIPTDDTQTFDIVVISMPGQISDFFGAKLDLWRVMAVLYRDPNLQGKIARVMFFSRGYLEASLGCEAAKQLDGVWGICLPTNFLKFLSDHHRYRYESGPLEKRTWATAGF